MQKAWRLMLILSIVGCGGSATEPGEASESESGALKLNGTYSGNASDDTGPGKMSWTISQNGSTVSGSVKASSTTGSAIFSGTVSGTLSGTYLKFTITVPHGGISKPGYSNCSLDIDGMAYDVTSKHIVGTYSGKISCGGSFSNGKFDLSSN